MLGFASATAVADTTRAGTVTLVTGEVSITHAGGTARSAAVGADISARDTIVTGADSELQAELEDGGMIALRPNSVFRIDEFRAEGEDTDTTIFSLLKGAVRSVTGFVGKTSPQNYQINTPTATIGVRGTDHEVIIVPEDQVGADEIAGTHDRVYEGQTFIKAGENTVEIKAGQAGYYNASLAGHPRLHNRIPAFIERRRFRHDDRVENHRRNIIERMEYKLRQHGKLKRGERWHDFINHRHAYRPRENNAQSAPETKPQAHTRRELRRRRHRDR
jgi:hypothetical protein